MPLTPDKKWTTGAGASYLGMFFVAVVCLGGVGGAWLDQKFHTSPLLALLGVSLGMAGGIREMLKVLKENAAPPKNKIVAGAASNPPEVEQARGSASRDTADAAERDPSGPSSDPGA